MILRTKLVVGIMLVCLLSGCGSQSYSSGGAAYDSMTSVNGVAGLSGSSMKQTVASPENSYEVDYESQTSEDISGESQDGSEIQKDMLVYRGSVSLTTKDYAGSMQGVQELFRTYDCFVESSHEYSSYRSADEQDLMTFDATIRVNSKDYDAFMNSVGNLGVVASTSSTVQNMNLEYSDTVTALRIQQARLDRYLARLESETDNEIALQLEREITNIQIELAQLESRKNIIETDVAYSYVDLTIREVKAYSAQVSHTDSFLVRLKAEIVNTYFEFTEFLVCALFFFIHAFPYLVILAILVVVFRKKFKGKIRLPKLRKKKGKDEEGS